MSQETGTFFECPGQYEYDGILYTVGFPVEILDRIRNGGFQTDEEDVIIASYPKAGTSWMQNIVSLIYGIDDLEATKSIRLAQRVPFLEFEVIGEQAELLGIAARKPPRLIKTHLPARFLTNIENVANGKTRIIYVMRNTKDTLVSYYHFYRMNKYFGCFPGSWDEFFEMFKHNKIGLGNWFDMTLEWWAYRDRYNVMFVKYEDLQKDLEGQIRAISEFCGRTLTEAQLGAIVESSSFQMMTKPNQSLSGSKALNENVSRFMRKGQVGDWVNYFTPEQNAYFDELYEKRMSSSGLSFQFLPEGNSN